jgi:hypothetical protein
VPHVFSPALWGFGIAVSSPTDFCQVCVNEGNGSIALQVLRASHDTLPWLISFSLGSHTSAFDL